MINISPYIGPNILPNVIIVDKKCILYHRPIVYHHKHGSIVFSIWSQIIQSWFRMTSMVYPLVKLFTYVIYSSNNPHSRVRPRLRLTNVLTLEKTELAMQLYKFVWSSLVWKSSSKHNMAVSLGNILVEAHYFIFYSNIAFDRRMQSGSNSLENLSCLDGWRAKLHHGPSFSQAFGIFPLHSRFQTTGVVWNREWTRGISRAWVVG